MAFHGIALCTVLLILRLAIFPAPELPNHKQPNAASPSFNSSPDFSRIATLRLRSSRLELDHSTQNLISTPKLLNCETGM